MPLGVFCARGGVFPSPCDLHGHGHGPSPHEAAQSWVKAGLAVSDEVALEWQHAKDGAPCESFQPGEAAVGVDDGRCGAGPWIQRFWPRTCASVSLGNCTCYSFVLAVQSLRV